MDDTCPRLLSTTESVASPKKAKPKAPNAALVATHHKVALFRTERKSARILVVSLVTV